MGPFYTLLGLDQPALLKPFLPMYNPPILLSVNTLVLQSGEMLSRLGGRDDTLVKLTHRRNIRIDFLPRCISSIL